MTEDVMLKFKAFCNEQSNCSECPIHLCYRIIDPNHPGKLLDICEKRVYRSNFGRRANYSDNYRKRGSKKCENLSVAWPDPR